jgi:hypothetical protein
MQAHGRSRLSVLHRRRGVRFRDIFDARCFVIAASVIEPCFELRYEVAALANHSRDQVIRAPSRFDLGVKRLPQVGGP